MLQEAGYGVDPKALEGDEFAAFLRFNVLAAVAELMEALAEMPWKPWAKYRGRPDDEGRKRAVVEVVDALHFIGNVLVLLRVSQRELNQVYAEKSNLNYDRQVNGYQGRVLPAGVPHGD